MKYATLVALDNTKFALNPDQVVSFYELSGKIKYGDSSLTKAAKKFGVVRLRTRENSEIQEGDTVSTGCWDVRGTFEEIKLALEHNKEWEPLNKDERRSTKT